MDVHFLKDTGMAQRLLELADLREEDVVLEIGAGKGFLTRIIAKEARVIAVEKEEFAELKELPERASVIFGDALKEISHFNFTKVVSNPPFTLLEALLRSLIFKDFLLAVLIVPTRFAEKMKANFFFSSLYNIDIAFNIPQENFDPPPDTEAVALVVKRRLDERSEIIKELFTSRKKTKNFLRNYFERHGMTKREARQTASSLEIPERILRKASRKLRPEEMETIFRSMCNRNRH